MPRFARVVIPGCPHHITQCGNNRQPVFLADDDYAVYLELLAEQAAVWGVAIAGYCLMPNHVHLIATPSTSESLARAVGRTHYRYTQYVNRLHARSGHLWQNRFFSCPLDARHSRRAMVYVERNPVKARLCRKAWRWRWSSAAAHCGQVAGGAVNLARWAYTPEQWREALSAGDDEFAALIDRRTQTGRPLGGNSFVSKLESRLGRRLRALPVGRPPKRPGAR